MNQLEFEMYHQIKNAIDVNPTLYEYPFTINADTTVDLFSLSWLISAMVHEKKVLGACGETTLSDAKQSVMMMMQVYEYFISHHRAKAFESFFGSVTCLPGCFTLFHLRTADTHKPLMISESRRHIEYEGPVAPWRRSLFDDTVPAGTIPYAQDPVHPRCPRAHECTRWLGNSSFTSTSLGKLDGPQLWELMFLDQLCGFCCSR
ncbi:chitin synthase-domain-containing protein [Boletus coccyginus]|nr:chitin synthase-domain-containing protein [Boletus coccyginus]